MVKVSSKVVKETKVDNKGWFALIKDLLNILVDERKRVLMEIRNSRDTVEGLKHKHRDTKNNASSAISVVKIR